MTTDKFAEHLRKLTLSTPFTFEDFKKMTKRDDKVAVGLFHNLMKDCHIKPSGEKAFVVIHGEDRKELIKSRLKACEDKIKEWYGLYEHLQKLK